MTANTFRRSETLPLPMSSNGARDLCYGYSVVSIRYSPGLPTTREHRLST